MNDIEITNIPALRAALHVRAKQEYQAVFCWIILEAPREGEDLGRMVATDGFSLLLSPGAHNSSETVYIRPEGKWKVPQSAKSATVMGDALHIEKPNGRDIKPLEVSSDVGTWPDYRRIIPSPDAPKKVLYGPVDSIRAGRNAEAYLGSKHTVGDAAWIPMPGGKLAELHGAKLRGDTFIQVPLTIGGDIGWVTESEGEGD